MDPGPAGRSTFTSPAVSAVTCRQAAMARPANGRAASKSALISPSAGMARSAQPIRASPAAASSGSAMSDWGPVIGQ